MLSIAGAVTRASSPARHADKLLDTAKCARLQAHLTPVRHMIDGQSEPVVVIVPERHEAEGLQHACRRFAGGTEDFGHALHGAGFGLEGDLDEIALSQAMSHLEQAAGNRNTLESSFSAPAVFQANRSQDSIA
jgi:hypothetical protein